MALSEIDQKFAPQTSIGMSDNVEFDTMTPATKALLRVKTVAEKVIAYYGFIVPNPGNPTQAYNVNNKSVWDKIGVGRIDDCHEPVYADTMNGDSVPVKLVAKKEDHERILREYCRTLGLGIVEEYDRATNTIKNIGGARNALTKLNAMGLPVSQFQEKKDKIETSDFDILDTILDDNNKADDDTIANESTDDTAGADTSTTVDNETAGSSKGEQNTDVAETGPEQKQGGADTEGHPKNGSRTNKLLTKLTKNAQ